MSPDEQFILILNREQHLIFDPRHSTISPRHGLRESDGRLRLVGTGLHLLSLSLFIPVVLILIHSHSHSHTTKERSPDKCHGRQDRDIGPLLGPHERQSSIKAVLRGQRHSQRCEDGHVLDENADLQTAPDGAVRRSQAQEHRLQEHGGQEVARAAAQEDRGFCGRGHGGVWSVRVEDQGGCEDVGEHTGEGDEWVDGAEEDAVEGWDGRR